MTMTMTMTMSMTVTMPHELEQTVALLARTKILLYGVGPTTNSHVHPVRCLARLILAGMYGRREPASLS